MRFFSFLLSFFLYSHKNGVFCLFADADADCAKASLADWMDGLGFGNVYFWLTNVREFRCSQFHFFAVVCVCGKQTRARDLGVMV